MDTAPEESSIIEQEILDKTVEFPLGIPGFIFARKFVFSQGREQRPFAWMKSLDQEGLSFVVIEAYNLIPDYSAEINDVDLESIGSPSPVQCAIFFIVKIEKTDKVRLIVHTGAPIIINTKLRKGRQVLVSLDGKPQPQVFEL